jgi:hypothetical protein
MIPSLLIGLSRYDATAMCYYMLFVICCADIFMILALYSQHLTAVGIWEKLILTHHICAMYCLGVLFGIIFARSTANKHIEDACTSTV